MKTIHVVVATGAWEQDQLRYRRHRLAEFLYKQPNTQEVIWLCPSSRKSKKPITLLPNGVKQWSIPDLAAHKIFRFGRYLDFFYQNKLKEILRYLEKHTKGFQLVLWYTFPGFPLLTDLISWNHIVYDCSDLWSESMSGKTSGLSKVRQVVISKAENRIIKKASSIFCTSDYLRDKVLEQPIAPEKVFTFENGVEFNLFANNKTRLEKSIIPNKSSAVLGFIGGIKPKLDFNLLREVVQKKPQWLLVLVGPDQTNNSSDFKALLNEPNVLWVGSVAPSEVPNYMNMIDIGIMPYKASPYNDAVFPLKLFEFLAAGRPVVGVNLPSTNKFMEFGIYHHVETSQDFIEACELAEQLNGTTELESKRRENAQRQDWASIFSSMVLITGESKKAKTNQLT